MKLGALALVTLISAVSLAAAAEPSQTWFFMEFNQGVGVHSDLNDAVVGPVGRLSLGVGGKLTGHPLRWFLVGGVGVFSSARYGKALAGESVLKRTLIDYGIGARVLTPLVAPIRVYGEAQLGYGHVLSDVQIASLESYHTALGALSLLTALGVQARILRVLSLGLRWEWSGVFARSGHDFASSVAELPQPGQEGVGRHALLLSTTVHF